MTTEFDASSSVRSTPRHTSAHDSFKLPETNDADIQLGNGSPSWTAQLDVFNKENLAQFRNLFPSTADQVRKTASQIPETWIAFGDGPTVPEKSDAKASTASVKPTKDLGAGVDAVMEANKGKAPPYDFSSVAGDIKASALRVFQSGDPEAFHQFQSNLNSAIKSDHIGCVLTQKGDELEMRMVQQIPRKDQAKYNNMSKEDLEKEGLVRLPGWGVCKELAKPEKIDVPKTEPEKLKAATENITAAITHPKNEKEAAAETAKAFQDALNQGISLRELMQSVNKSLPDNQKPSGQDAVTANNHGERTTITVHPGIGGFTLKATEKGGKWAVEDTGEVLRGS